MPPPTTRAAAAMNTLHRIVSSRFVVVVRTSLAFSVLGFVNTILPFLIFSACYLIIPFPRPTVVAIETLPYIAAKLLFPAVILPLLPTWFRPLLLAFGWVAGQVVTWATPPNVGPAVRIIASCIASVTSSVGDSVFLGLLPSYGKSGLVAWGCGTGLGYVASAVLPYFLTVRLGLFLRDVHRYVPFGAGAMLVAYFIFMPRGNPSRDRGLPLRKLDDEDDDDEEAGSSLLMQDPLRQRIPDTARSRLGRAMKLIFSTCAPLATQLLLTTSLQVMVFPGTARTLAASFDHFKTFLSFSAAYGLAFQVGNTVGRVSILVFRLHRLRLHVARYVVMAILVLLNAMFLVVRLPAFVGLAAWFAGLLGGMVYINVIAAAVDDARLKTMDDRVLLLGTIGAAEGMGWLVGGVVGSVLEMAFCGMELGSEERWCHTTR